MQPKISIIIPVYNVEKYLRQCLESVIGQTLQELQILCVDHSSTDGSLEILKEFAEKDPRVEIVSCENTGGGPGQARNAGLSLVKSKYLYFVDSDDWLDTTLCEKAYYRLEQSEADVLFFYAHDIYESGVEKCFCGDDMNNWTQQSVAEDFCNFPGAPWTRVIRTAYLKNVDFRFPEGNLPEDNYYHWVSLVHQPRVLFLPQKLYYYRHRAGSQVGQQGEYVANLALVFALNKQYLIGIDKYEEFREKLLFQKFCAIHWAYNYVFPEYRDKVKQNILGTIDDDEIAYIKEEKNLPKQVRDHYLDLLNLTPDTQYADVTWLKRTNYRFFRSLVKFLKKVNRACMRPLEQSLRRILGKPQKTSVIANFANPGHETLADRQIRLLSEVVCLLSKEVVELRNQSVHDATENRTA